jgi:hypothetical protein
LYVPGEYSYSVEQKTDEITESKAQDLLLSRSIKRHKLKEYVLNKISFFGEIPLMKKVLLLLMVVKELSLVKLFEVRVFILEKNLEQNVKQFIQQQ